MKPDTLLPGPVKVVAIAILVIQEKAAALVTPAAGLAVRGTLVKVAVQAVLAAAVIQDLDPAIQERAQPTPVNHQTAVSPARTVETVAIAAATKAGMQPGPAGLAAL